MSRYSGIHLIRGVKAIWLQNVGYVAAKPIEEFREGDIIAYNHGGTGIFISKKEVSPKYWEIVTKEDSEYSDEMYSRKVKKGTLKPYYTPRETSKSVERVGAVPKPPEQEAAKPAAKKVKTASAKKVKTTSGTVEKFRQLLIKYPDRKAQTIERMRGVLASHVLGRDFGESMEDYYARRPDIRMTDEGLQALIAKAEPRAKKAAAPKPVKAAKPTQKELAHAKELGKAGYWAGKQAPAQDAKILDMCRQRSHDAMMALMTAWSKGWGAEHQIVVDKELFGKGLIMPGMEAKPAPSPLPNVPMGLGGGGIPPIPGVGAAAAPKVTPKVTPKPAAVPPALAPAAAPKRKTAAKPAPKPTKRKAKKTVAKPAKNGKPKKPAPAGTVLTAAQKKRLAADGSVTVKRGGKFVTVTR